MNNSAVVLSMDQAPEVEKIYLEQGDGLKATRIMLYQGVVTDLTVQDDATYFATLPNVGSSLVVRNVVGTVTANVANCAVFTYSGTIVDSNVKLARKQEGHRVIRVENIALIDTTA
jgi:hypothetical protein